MADDDVNKKGDKVNGTKIPKAIQEMANKYDRDTDYEASLNDEKLQRLVDKALEYEEKYNSASAGSAQQRTYAMQHGIAEEEAHSYSLTVDQALTAKSNKVLARSLDVYSKSGNINRRTTTMAGQQSYRGAAKTGGGIFRPTNMIESEIQSDIEAASAYGGALADEARGLNVNDSSQGIRERSGKLGEYEERIARNKALLKVQSREGISTEKLTNRGEDLDRDVDSFFKRKDIDNRINSGGVKSYKEESAELSKRREERSIAQGDYEKAIETGAEGVEAFAEKLHKANEALDEQTRVVKGMSDKGMDKDRGIFGKYSGGVQFAQMGLQAVGAIAGATNTIAVDQDITQMNNRASFAKMGNAIYDKANAAVKGHSVDAMLDVLGSDGFAKQFGDTNKGITNVAKSIEGGAGLLTNVLTGMGKGAAIGGVAGVGFAGIGAVPGAIGGAAIGGITAAANSIPAITNVAYGNEGAASSINSYAAAKNLTAEERHIRAQQMQAFYNQGLNTYETTAGAGSTSKLQSQLMNESNLNALADRGVSAEKAAGLAGILNQAGSMNTFGGFNIIGSAGKAKQHGQMGEEEYVSAAARMVAAGGDNTDLEGIIAKATAAGMDNSKNIGQMVDATLSLNSGLAKSGVGGTSTTADLLAGATQSLVGSGVNKNLATGMAASGVEGLNNLITSNSLSFGSIIQQQKIRTMPGMEKATQFQVNNLSSLSVQELAVLKADNEESRQLAKVKGIDNLVYGQDGKLNKKMVKDLGRNALEKGLLNVGSAEQNRSILGKYDRGEEFESSENAILSAANTNAAAVGALAGTNKISKAYASNMKDGSQTDILGAKRTSKEIGMGEKESGGFDKIEKAMAEVSKAIDPAKWGESVNKAAEKFEIPAGKFLAATGQLDGTVERLIKHQEKMMEYMGEPRYKNSAPSTEKRPK